MVSNKIDSFIETEGSKVAISGIFPLPSSEFVLKCDLNNIMITQFIDGLKFYETLHQLMECCKKNSINHLVVGSCLSNYYQLSKVLSKLQLNVLSERFKEELSLYLYDLKTCLEYNFKVSVAAPLITEETIFPETGDKIKDLVISFPLLEIKETRELFILHNRGSPDMKIMSEYFQKLYPSLKVSNLCFSEQMNLY